MDNKVHILFQKKAIVLVFYLYCPGQWNVHSCCELENETLVVVKCGELLAGNLRGKFSILQLTPFYILVCFSFQCD